MAGSAHLELEAEGPLLPPELLWVYLIAPIGAAPMMLPNYLNLPAGEMLQQLLAMYIPFLGFSGSFHVLYKYFVPSLLRHVPRQRHWLVHALLAVGVTVAMSVVIHPLVRDLCHRNIPYLQFVLSSVAFSCAFLSAGLLVQHWRQRAINTERVAFAERQAALESQFQVLQARTNPHFFFNSINTVASLIPDDPVLAERTLERLADLFRYALDATKMRTVPLQREIEVACDYLEIQKARFGDRLQVHLSIDPNAGAIAVPPLLLQPLVENAIFHGVGSRGRGLVSLTVKQEGAQIVIDVVDDGPGLGASEHQGSQSSTRDLRERLRIFWGEQSSFDMQGAPGGGCLARLAIPAAQVAT